MDWFDGGAVAEEKAGLGGRSRCLSTPAPQPVPQPYPDLAGCTEAGASEGVSAKGAEVSGREQRAWDSLPAYVASQALFCARSFDVNTKSALKRLQEHYGLTSDGVAGTATFRALNALQDGDGTTINFDWSEFWQNDNPNCSSDANSYAGTFAGGPIPAGDVKKNVRRLMWRLEALRAKLGGRPIAINSGYRGVAYNQCIGGATSSQHMYGTALDMKVVDTTNRAARDVAKASQLEGIGCYSSLTHNHLDLRMENKALPSAQSWWWPDKDAYNRDLADDNRPCYGETISGSSRVSAGASGDPSRSQTWSKSELDAWERAGEPDDMGAGD